MAAALGLFMPDECATTSGIAATASLHEYRKCSSAYLDGLKRTCTIAFEPTGEYHRALMHRLGQAGFTLRQVSSLAVARTRDAMYNGWDKNDPKDAQVILHLLKTGTTQRFVDPLVSGHHDLQEMANTYQQGRPQSAPSARDRDASPPTLFSRGRAYLHSSRAEWFTSVLRLTPCPAAVRRYSKAAFIAAARAGSWDIRRTRPGGWLISMRPQAQHRPAGEPDGRISMFRVVLEEYQQLCRRRKHWRRISSPDSRVIATSTACRRCRASDRFWRCSSWLRPVTCGALGTSASFLSTVASTCARSSRDSFEARPTCRSAATLDCATPAGWPVPLRCACSRTVFAGSLTTTCGRIRSTRTDGARRTLRSPRRWRA